MAPTVMLERPADRENVAVGNDGLTDAERDDYVAAYRVGAAKPLDESEHQAIAKWLAGRAHS